MFGDNSLYVVERRHANAHRMFIPAGRRDRFAYIIQESRAVRKPGQGIGQTIALDLFLEGLAVADIAERDDPALAVNRVFQPACVLFDPNFGLVWSRNSEDDVSLRLAGGESFVRR